MPAIEITARSYKSGADMLAGYAQARAALWRPVEPRADFGIDMKRTRPCVRAWKATEHVCISDDEYARFLAILAARFGLPGAAVPATTVKSVVARHFGISVAELLGKSRRMCFVLPRHVAVYIFVHGKGFSFPQTGRIMGARDHTTALHAYRNIVRRIECDSSFAEQVSGLMRACGL